MSNTATCGTAGNSRRISRMPATFTGLCSGASGLSASICASTFVGDERSFGELLAAMHDAMGDDAHFARAADDARFLCGEFGHHRLERLGEAAFRQVALHLALRAAMRESRAVDADAFDQTVRLARFVGRVVEAYLSDDEPQLMTRIFSGRSPLSLSP